MNKYGSYLKLMNNSLAAMMAAIEIYNKPKFEYRNECFVILLINAWELALKAYLSKNKKYIFYPKKRGQPYRTLSFSDAIKECEKIPLKEMDIVATKKNLELIIDFRDKATHFYNNNEISVILYSLSQTAIINYKDFLEYGLNKDISNIITLTLLPLALHAPIDPIQMLNKQTGKSKKNKHVNDFCEGLKIIVKDLENNNHDTGRVITTFTINLESRKKVTSADFSVKVDKTSKTNVVTKQVDPNVSYPLRQCDIVTDKNNLGKRISYGKRKLTSYVFQAILFHFKICSDKRKKHLYWRDNKTNTARYSEELIPFLKKLTEKQIEDALSAYKKHNSRKAQAE